MPAGPAIYLAGPEVFLPDSAELGAAKVAMCTAHGLDGRYPGDAVEALGDLAHLPPGEQARAFYDALVAQLDGCAALIANLTPFRGPSADVGTAWELGYAAGRRLPVFAYTNHSAHYGERIAPDGLLIEAFDLPDNLMLAASVIGAGAEVVRVDAGRDPVAALRDLAGFERCVLAAAVHLGIG